MAEPTMATGSSEIQIPASQAGANDAAASATEGAQGAKGTEAQAPAATDGGSQKEVVEPANGEAEAPKFIPKNKFKVMDSEHEVPSWMLEAIKNAETEKEALDLLTQAHGLSHVKENLQTTRKERDEVRSKFDSTMRDISEVKQAYQKGDIDLFLDKLQIPHERMLQWAVDKVNYSQLPPDQQRVIDERRDAQRKADLAEKQVGTYEQRLYEQMRTAKTQLLQAGLARPDVKTFADTYDAQTGKSGAFLDEVVAAGNLAWAQSNGTVDLTPEQAIEQVMQKWGKFIQPGNGAAAAASAVIPGPGSVVQAPASAKTAVIPNVAGRSTSPMKSKPRSLDDLKKLGKEMQATAH